MAKVVALGELLIDMVASSADDAGYPLLKANPGGAPANYLAALSEYGCETAFVGKVGNDAFGRLLSKTLEDRGICTSCLELSDEVFTTLAFVTLDASGNREFSFARKPGADTQLKLSDDSKKIIQSADVFHFGTLSLTDEPARTATMEAIELARNSGIIISCDPNYRKPLWRNEEEAKKWISWAVNQADVVKISDEEASFLWDADEKGAAEILLSGNCKLCFVTLGAKGCYYASKTCSGYVKGPEVNVVDTTGAGDIFGGAAMSQILKTDKTLADLTQPEIENAVRFAVTAASLSTERLGGISSVIDEKTVKNRI